MADIFLTCESCHGKRYKEETLEVTYNDKNITEVLDLTVDEALEFFKDQPKIIKRLKPLQDVGLGYIGLGQASNTLSGGEAQRVKLAFYLSGASSVSGPSLFLFDEPTTGLHIADIDKLMNSLNRLVEQGHTVIIIEHNMDVIKCADWIIDLGPEGGIGGGQIVFEGTPEDMIKKSKGHTAQFLKEKLG